MPFTLSPSTRTMRRRRVACVALGFTAVVAFGGCVERAATAPHPQPFVPAAAMTCKPQSVARLYFGAHTPDGEVDDDAWQGFVASVIEPRFGDGYTVLEANGRGRSRDGTVVHERSRVLEVVGTDDLPTRAKLAEVVAGYKARFRQQDVLVTQSETRACV